MIINVYLAKSIAVNLELVNKFFLLLYDSAHHNRAIIKYFYKLTIFDTIGAITKPFCGISRYFLGPNDPAWRKHLYLSVAISDLKGVAHFIVDIIVIAYQFPCAHKGGGSLFFVSLVIGTSSCLFPLLQDIKKNIKKRESAVAFIMWGLWCVIVSKLTKKNPKTYKDVQFC